MEMDSHWGHEHVVQLAVGVELLTVWLAMLPLLVCLALLPLAVGVELLTVWLAMLPLLVRLALLPLAVGVELLAVGVGLLLAAWVLARLLPQDFPVLCLDLDQLCAASGLHESQTPPTSFSSISF
jgi:hypothetical protein